jgi:hypothetical protein
MKCFCQIVQVVRAQKFVHGDDAAGVPIALCKRTAKDGQQHSQRQQNPHQSGLLESGRPEADPRCRIGTTGRLIYGMDGWSVFMFK